MEQPYRPAALAASAQQTAQEEAKISALTACERQVITLVGAGLRDPQIARLLGISAPTVRQHLSAIFGKLGVIGRLELILYAYRHGLAKIPA